ncbi:MAG TPA: hypothetical protein VFG23_25095 [Polyangia bacterium]|nr:hypothetical protein [Polyangia bacterium]
MDCATAPSPAAPRRRGKAARALVLSLGGLCAAAACSLNQEGVNPPNDTFFYPSTAVADPSSAWLYVANSNADLRYNDGTLVAVDLVSAAADRANGGGVLPAAGGPVSGASGPTQTWGLCPQEDYVNPLSRSDPQICCWDLLDANILNCDERRYVQSKSTVRIGSFAAGMIWQPYCPDPCNANCVPPTGLAGRIFMGIRGDTSLTWADVTDTSTPSFLCGQTSNDSLAECQGVAHRILTAVGQVLNTEMNDHSAPAVNLPDEPYALQIDSAHGLLYVGHLAGGTATVDTGGVSLFDVSQTGGGTPRDPAFVAPFPSPFSPNNAGAFGITALEPHPPLGQPLGAPNVMFASSRYLPLVASIGTFGTLPPDPQGCPISNSDVVVEPAGDSLNPGLVGSEMRGVAFVDPPAPPSVPNMTPPPPTAASRVYALERVPPDLVGFDIATNQAGTTTAIPTDFSETCSSPTFLYQHDAGEGPRLYVNCFDTGEIYVFDPAVPTLITTFQIGRGPAGLVFDDQRKQAYVIGFSDNNLSVVDLAPGSQTQYHVIQRIGFPSVMPR